MSRTEGVHLPRLPPSHARAASSHAIQPHVRSGRSQHHKHITALSEPHYTAYIGTPRQDVPGQVYRDAAMFDDVFDKQGRLLASRTTPKITSPLSSVEYNSLHDPHCQRLFLNNRALREHLVHLGMLTDDLRVVASTKEQRQKIRAHELLERKEQLIQKLDEREKRRLHGLQRQSNLPSRYLSSIRKSDEQRERLEQIRRIKEAKTTKAKEENRQKEEEKKRRRKQQLVELMEQIKLLEQTKRNEERAKQEMAEILAYEKQYGKTAVWHREADIIHNRMVLLQQTKWAHKKHVTWLSESYSGQPATASTSSTVDIDTLSSYPPTVTCTSPAPPPAATTRHTHTPPPGDDAVELPAQEIPAPEHEQTEDDTEAPTSPAETKKGDQKELENVISEDPDGSSSKPVMESGDQPGDLKQSWDSEKVADKTLLAGEQYAVNKADQKLDQTQSALELSQLFADILVQADPSRTGYITIDDFAQLLQSRDLGLSLDQQELLYLATEADIQGTGWISISQVASFLPGLLTAIFQQRMELELQHYGQYTEDQWCFLQSPYKVLYMEKTTGLVQYERPDDFRPHLRDDLFEEVIVELFMTADTNCDGYIDGTDFYNLLQSSLVSTRLYSDQMEQVYIQFQSQLPQEGVINLEQFTPLAHAILLMIYKNSYPNQDWVELHSHKCGRFYLNTNTGDTKCDDTGVSQTQWSEPEQVHVKRSSRKKKKSKHKDAAVESISNAVAPPPLRRRASKSRDSDRLKEEEGETMVEEDKQTKDREQSEEERDRETQTLVEQVAERLQGGLNIINTIPEEEEDEKERDPNRPDQVQQEAEPSRPDLQQPQSSCPPATSEEHKEREQVAEDTVDNDTQQSSQVTHQTDENNHHDDDNDDATLDDILEQVISQRQ